MGRNLEFQVGFGLKGGAEEKKGDGKNRFPAEIFVLAICSISKILREKTLYFGRVQMKLFSYASPKSFE